MGVDVNLKSVLDEKLIVIDLKASTKEEVIAELSEVLYRNNRLISKEVYLKDVLEREQHCTTGIGSSIAIPHGKSEGVKQTSIAVAKLLQGIDWQSLDDKPVKMVFLLSVRKEDSEDIHLRTISKVASLLTDEEITSKLINSQTPEEIITLLCG